MAINFPPAVKRVGLVAAISRLSKPRQRRYAEIVEPRVRAMDEEDDLDAILFDSSRTELDETASALDSEMNRLDAALGSLREMLGVFADAAPSGEDSMPSYAYAALHEDRDLFDGEPAFAGEMVTPEGDLDYLFVEDRDPKGVSAIRKAA